MPIVTRVQKRQTIQNVAYAVICLGLGIWGWYDYAVTIPRDQAAFDEFMAAEASKSDLEERSRTAMLTDEQKREFRAAEEVLARYTEKPTEPAAYDRPVQLWLYIVGCGVLGTPWFLYAQWNLQRRRYRLEDDGSFHAPEGTFAKDDLVGIDMSRWMEKSIALVETRGGARILLDDYKWSGIEDIVAALAARFHPGEWTSDARPIGDPKSRDTVAADTSARETAAQDPETAPPQGS